VADAPYIDRPADGRHNNIKEYFMSDVKPYYPILFRPGKIGSLVVPNRIVMAPMATNFAGETGGMTDTLVEFYERRAKGGTGLIIAENCCVDFPCGKGGACQLRLDDDRFIPGIHRLVEGVHYHGAKVAIQINHSGPSGMPAKTEGEGPVGASAVNWGPQLVLPRVLAVDEIEVIIEKFAQAVLRAQRAGFDAVELHAGHCYLIAHFLSPYTNRRTDHYGGDLAGRMRFLLQIIRRCRELVGQVYPIMVRFSVDEFLDGGRKVQESQQVATALATAGVDALHVTAGTHAAVHPSGTCTADPVGYEQGWRVYLAEAIKAVVNIPVIAVGVIREPEVAEAILAAGRADFVALGRGLIADPDWANKARSGAAEDIRKCVSCNEGCIRRRVFMDLPIRCAVNKEVGRPSRFRAQPITGQPKRVLVIGGGPAGMEAARVLKIRGHAVTLWEKSVTLGGQVRLASVPAFKRKLRFIPAYLEHQLRRLAVPCILNQKATRDNVLDFAPDAVVLATGAIPMVPSIPGIEGPLLTGVEDVLIAGYVGSGARIVVMGGGVKGAEIALFLAQHGEVVTIVEMMDQVAVDIEPISRQDLLSRLATHKVRLLTGTKIISCKTNSLEVATQNGETMEVPADKAIACIGYRSVNELEALLATDIPALHVIGDCRRPRMIFQAMAEAYEAASKI
jgi:2,4-dienoyl-CoA reductase-like NADH-dependent reductase (Old Yellow Enzyme family)/thioredoxin reductase